ncbi:MAG: polyphosphate polymerase domain-containing protein [Bacteroidota bacterium]
MRYERKYKVDDMSLAVAKQILKWHPASFRPLYPDRQINNIYFDTPNLTTYHENVMGISERKKYRVRWYGDDVRVIGRPRFEMKIKNNQLGSKEVLPIDEFRLDDLRSLTQGVNRLSRAPQALRPVLLNAYRRSYYGTSDGHFRITIDETVHYFSFLNAFRFTRFNLSDQAIIVELKYEQALEGEAAQKIMQHLPFRQTKSSKYVNGMNLTVF